MEHTPKRVGTEKHDKIFRQQVIPDLLSDAAADLRHPTVVFLGGQPGVGKSSSKELVFAAFADRGDILDLGVDHMRSFHPAFPNLGTLDEITRAEAIDGAIGLDAREWIDKALDYSIAQRSNVLLDSNLAAPDRARELIDKFSEAGYRVEVTFVAGSLAQSRLGVLSLSQ
jgi:hypothetical protein